MRDIESRFSSHLPVLKSLFDLYPIKTVFEYGCGLYSTKFFVENANFVTSVEMSSVEWFEMVQREIQSDNFNLKYLPDNLAVEFFKESAENYDLIFVDGIKRIDCINVSFTRAPIICVHDVGKWYLSMSVKKIKKPNNYKFLVFKGKPSTGVYTNLPDLYDKLSLLQ